MSTILLTVASAVAMLVVVYGLWIGVHSLAAVRLGPRKLGCKGPTRDAEGNAVCCTTSDACTGEGRRRQL